jgi:hypothetical protein
MEDDMPNLSAAEPAGALYAAAARATLAPSIHNSQPWRFVVQPDALELHADLRRRAGVIDPHGRQLTISCGAALFGARAALAAAGVEVTVTPTPDSGHPELLARLEVVGAGRPPDPDAQRLDAVAEQRHSNRRRFGPETVPAEQMERLESAAAAEGAWLHAVRDLDDRITVARLSQRADAQQNADPAYRAELRAWTSTDPERPDGVPAAVVPRVTGAAHDDVPIRDFDTRGSGELPTETRSSLNQTLVVLGADCDGPRDWLAVGQALDRVLLELTAAGFVASVLSQVSEIPSIRQQLRDGLRLSGYPCLLLRAGKADPTPATPRRPLADVISPGAIGAEPR